MKTHETHQTFETTRVAYLVCAFMEDTISEQEQIELNHWLEEDIDERNFALFNALTRNRGSFNDIFGVNGEA